MALGKIPDIKPKSVEVFLIAGKTAIVIDYQFYTRKTVEFKTAS